MSFLSLLVYTETVFHRTKKVFQLSHSFTHRWFFMVTIQSLLVSDNADAISADCKCDAIIPKACNGK